MQMILYLMTELGLKVKLYLKRIMLNLDGYPAENIDELLKIILRQTNSKENLKHLNEVNDGQNSRL